MIHAYEIYQPGASWSNNRMQENFGELENILHEISTVRTLLVSNRKDVKVIFVQNGISIEFRRVSYGYVHSQQGGKIGRIFANWAILFFRQFFDN
jgi:hypothetical protein